MIRQICKNIKSDSFKMAALNSFLRNAALKNIITELETSKESIFKSNKLDLEAAVNENLNPAIIKRLAFDQDKLKDVVKGIESLISLEDPLNKVLLSRELDADLILKQVSCPIGVIGVIFESRPDALVQIATLCLKSGNCCILKGGSEARHTNKILFELISKATKSSGIPEGFLTLFETREAISELLNCSDSIDLIIPRGSNEFVQYIMSNTKIPVMGHADGICHVYLDSNCDIDLGVKVVIDSKVQYVAACNAVETILVHESIAKEFLPKLKAALEKEKVEIRGCENTMDIIDCNPATEIDFSTEYLDYVLSIKIVGDISDAIRHINAFGSHHTDCIITRDEDSARRFMLEVDSAGVYQNCSTRFADGYRYGFGAEVGISTGKLHARGPVGLSGLVTYKYQLKGNGNIVSDYASGKRSFHFKNL
ncbi:MAG: glutamate-5-semialdehyde dehydrogenase [Eubacteriales bacterium]